MGATEEVGGGVCIACLCDVLAFWICPCMFQNVPRVPECPLDLTQGGSKLG